MKFLLGLIFFGFNLFSSELPDCFTPDNVIKAAYFVKIKVNEISKEDLVKVMISANDGERHIVKEYPIFNDDQTEMSIKLTPSDTILEYLGDLYFDMIKSCVEEKMNELAAVQGVTISCIAKTKKINLVPRFYFKVFYINKDSCYS